MTTQYEVINDVRIAMAEPVEIPDSGFVGREEELELCRAAWGVNEDGTEFLSSDLPPMAFRLEGPPGLGKNEIVYQLARKLNRPLYILQGHEELTPEDLALLLTPDPDSAYQDSVPQLILRASPLATALHYGGLLFFDEINRVPDRALSPLASVLDRRQYVFSAMTGMNIGARDDVARRGFRFCCALNPALSHAGRVLPEYIQQRTLPLIEITPPPFDELRTILESELRPPPEFLEAFEEWYLQREQDEVSVRQALALMNFAIRHRKDVGEAKSGVFDRIAPRFLGKR